MFDTDTINQLNKERYQERLDENKKKNSILNMANIERKTELYVKNFGTATHDDSYLEGNIF